MKNHEQYENDLDYVDALQIEQAIAKILEEILGGAIATDDGLCKYYKEEWEVALEGINDSKSRAIAIDSLKDELRRDIEAMCMALGV